MANKKYEEANIQAIADAIREKTGTENIYDTSEMASGVSEVYDAGKQSEYDAFWKSHGTNRFANNWNMAFAGYGWNDNTFKPPIGLIINVQSGTDIFRSCRITNLKKIFEERKITFNVLNCPYLEGLFQTSQITYAPDLVAPNSSLNQLCYGATMLRSLKITVSDNGNQTWNNSFYNTTSLTELLITGGVIGRNLSVAQSPLTVDSMKSIISHLKDYSGTENEFKYTVTFSSACRDLLDAEGATSPNGNTWRDYATDLGWNC